MNKKSYNQGPSDLPRLYSSYSPDASANQGSNSYRATTILNDPPKISQPLPYASLTSLNPPITNPLTPVTTSNINIKSSYTYPQQSPNDLGLIQNLSAFDSLSKDIRIEDMLLQSLGSANLGTKGYITDLTMSPQSKTFTPVKDPLEMQSRNFASLQSSAGQERPKNTGLLPIKEEAKGSYSSYAGDSYGIGGSMSAEGYRSSNQENLGGYSASAGVKVKDVVGSPNIYEPSYIYSSDTKLNKSPAANLRGYTELPYQSGALDLKSSLSGIGDQFAGKNSQIIYESIEAKPNAFSIEITNTQGAKDYIYTGTSDVKARPYNLYGDARGLTDIRGIDDNTATFSSLGKTAVSYNIDTKEYLDYDQSMNKSSQLKLPVSPLERINEEKITPRSPSYQDYSYKQDLKEPSYDYDMQGSGQKGTSQPYSYMVQTNIYDKDLKYSPSVDVGSYAYSAGYSSGQKEYGSAPLQGYNLGSGPIREELGSHGDYGSHQYESGLRGSSYRVTEEGSAFEDRTVISPGLGKYKSGLESQKNPYQPAWYGDLEEMKRYMSEQSVEMYGKNTEEDVNQEYAHDEEGEHEEEEEDREESEGHQEQYSELEGSETNQY